MFNGITAEIFDDPEFKEDSVREIIISPIISRLGYLPAGTQKVVRSRSVKHPFIRVGTKNYPVTLVPDYLFLNQDKPIFVLDAKGPRELVLDEEHIRQVYSYSIHPEIKCTEFGICNGRQLAVFNVDQNSPTIVLNFEEYEARWEEIEKLMSPKYLIQPFLRKFRPDFGIKLKKLGFGKDVDMVIPMARLDIFAKLNETMMTAGANCEFANEIHCVNFDFPTTMLNAMLTGLPSPLKNQFIDALNRAPFQAMAGLAVEVDLVVRLGDETRGTYEVFVPLMVREVRASRFNPEPVPDYPQDRPEHVFQLRNAFKVKYV